MGERDRGSVSTFVVMLVVVFVASAGLAVDSARYVAAHVAAGDHAENAARVGAQEISGIRSGTPRLDPGAARAAAQRYLTLRGITGSVRVTGNRVTVTVTARPTLSLLGSFGISPRPTSATRSADPVRG
jgi:hypothetical protein